MSRYKSLAHAIWYCHYHVVWVPKYRFRILKDAVKTEVENVIRRVTSQLECIIEEMNVREDHVHLVVMIPPKLSVSKFVGTVKGKCAIKIFTKFSNLKIKPYWGNHFWARGYCVDTVGLDLEKIKKYVKYQEQKERQLEIRN